MFTDINRDRLFAFFADEKSGFYPSDKCFAAHSSKVTAVLLKMFTDINPDRLFAFFSDKRRGFCPS